MELKYKFNTLEEVKGAIEKWFKDCGYDGPDTDGKQEQKIFEEIEELEAEIKSGNVENQKSEAGDVFVTLVGKELKEQKSLSLDFIPFSYDNLKHLIVLIKYRTIIGDYDMTAEYLKDICLSLNLDLLECATIAYNKIQGRLERGELKVINGTVVKSGK